MKDYKQKYEQALERARRINNGEGIAALPDYTICETIFPELKESKDERIRKALLEYFGEQCDMSVCNGIYCYEVYDWLEKQGERKPTWSKEDEKMLNHLIDVLYGIPDARFIPIKREIMIHWLQTIEERMKGE